MKTGWIIVASGCFLGLAAVCLLQALENFYQGKVVAWCDEREALFVEVFQAARVIMGRQHNFTRGSHGLMYEGNDLPYTTLSEMLMLEQDQRGLLVVAMDHLTLWELEHPVPEKPKLLKWLRR